MRRASSRGADGSYVLASGLVRTISLPLGVPFAQSLKVDKRQPGSRLYTHYPSYWSLQASYRLVERVAYTFGASAGLWVHLHGKTALSTFAEVYLSVSPYFRLLSK